MALKREQQDPHAGQNPALAQMVHRFARLGRSRAQMSVETGPDGHAALRAILIEINETMLPRRIRVEGGAGQQIDLYASNRRLLAVKANGFEPETAPNSPQKLAQEFAEALQSFITENDKVKILPPQKIASSKDTGVSVSSELLAHTLGLMDRWKGGDQADALKNLERASIASLHATACLSFSCERGPEKQLDQLKLFWREYTRNGAPKIDTWGGHDGKRECRAFGLDRQQCLIVVQLDHASMFLALLPREHLNTLAKI